MNDKTLPPSATSHADGACEVPIEEQCAETLEHYERVSMAAHEWNNQIPQAICAWFAAKASVPSEIAPLSTEYSERAERQQAASWLDVCNLLSELVPDWRESEGYVGVDKALNTIRKLASIPSATRPRVPREEVAHMVNRLRAYNPVEGQEGLRLRDMLLKEAALMIEDIYGQPGGA